ncbi:MAG: LysR substrate-binding domain-containing protein [Bryobacteraceae bacterium]|nr:LysR substrate-binding domain-containing protein [Bryobacteraceae bacterium]
MTFESLSLYRDIVQTRSVSRGAALNGISQSAASQSVQELERCLQVRLLDRSTRPLTVTEAGKLYYDYCRDILRRKEQFEAQLQGVTGRVAGTVRVAAIYSVGISDIASLEAEFTRRYPDADLHVDYLRPERVYEAVLEDRAELGLVSYPEGTRELTVLPWREEEMVLALSPSHALAGLRRAGAHELEGQDFVAFDDDLPIRQHVDRYLREHGVNVRIAMRFDNIGSMKEALALGQGVSILPRRMMLNEIALGTLSAVPLRKPLSRPLGIVRRKQQALPRAAERFLELLLETPL